MIPTTIVATEHGAIYLYEDNEAIERAVIVAGLLPEFDRLRAEKDQRPCGPGPSTMVKGLVEWPVVRVFLHFWNWPEAADNGWQMWRLDWAGTPELRTAAEDWLFQLLPQQIREGGVRCFDTGAVEAGRRV